MSRVTYPLVSLILAIALMCLSLAGCGSFSPRSDPSRFFTLSSLPQAEESVVKNSGTQERIFPRDQPHQVSRLS